MMDKSALIAVGGNALIADGQRGTIDEQFSNARVISAQVAALVEGGWRIVVTHGNGPQVGFILLRSELFKGSPFIPKLALDVCVADSQGGIGYIISNSLLNELGPGRVACLLTQTVVDVDDPAFRKPTKPIGPAFSEREANERREADGWTMVEDSGRGYRRVVPSPKPVRIIETRAIQALLGAGQVVVAAGGGGIPVVEVQPGTYRGVEAVIDKDLASAYLAASLELPLLVISTGVERVAIHFRQPDQRFLDRLSVTEARRYLAEGEFPKGSMGPKVEAAITFLERGGAEVLITSPANLEEAFAGRSGTRIVADAALASVSPSGS